MGFKIGVGLTMITINLDATAIARQLNCDRTTVYRVLRLEVKWVRKTKEINGNGAITSIYGK